LTDKFICGNAIVVDESFIDVLDDLATGGVITQSRVEGIGITNTGVHNGCRVSATTLFNGLVIIACEDRVHNTTREIRLFIAMTGNQNHRDTNRFIKVELVKLLVDRMAFSGINLGYTFIQECFELDSQVFGQILAGAISAGGVRLIPVMGIVNIFQPASNHDGELMSALGSQVSRPGQTENFEYEFLVDLSQIGLQNFCIGLAGSITGVITHL